MDLSKCVNMLRVLCISQFQAPTSPWADPRGNFLKWSKTLPRGKIFLQKRRNIGILKKSNLEKNWKAVQVISFSFSLSTILKVLKFSPSFQTDFVTREQQRDGTSV